MGSWGTGIFESDGAQDLFDSLISAPNGWVVLREALLTVAEADPDDTVEAPECEMALAAAECVAAVRGKPSATAGDELLDWCRAHPMKDASKLSALATRAVRRIRTSSELKDLWEGTDQGWDAVVADLGKRLL